MACAHRMRGLCRSSWLVPRHCPGLSGWERDFLWSVITEGRAGDQPLAEQEVNRVVSMQAVCDGNERFGVRSFQSKRCGEVRNKPKANEGSYLKSAGRKLPLPLYGTTKDNSSGNYGIPIQATTRLRMGTGYAVTGVTARRLVPPRFGALQHR